MNKIALSTNDIIVTMTFLSTLLLLFYKPLYRSITWRATITPLASIIGSGFLVSAPLLILTTGEWAAVTMVGITLLAYGIGSSLRYNIQHLEPLLKKPTQPQVIHFLEKLSRPVLGIAYIISVAFYLKLLSAFALRGFGIHSSLLENSLTTGLLLFIGITGKTRGLSMLEVFEVYAVNTKLAIIMALIIGHAVYNGQVFMAHQWLLKLYPHDSLWIATRKLLGVLIIIQGFETSRFIGHKYDAPTRIRTMRYAQLISGGIYIAFIATTLVAFNDIHTVGETTVIDLCRMMAPALPILLIIAAVMSQFSAAVADTIGSGGLLSETSNGRVSTNTSYLCITLLAMVLIWITNLYGIIVIASKGFALYYALQLIIACILLAREKRSLLRLVKLLFYALLTALMILVIVFGIPVE